ncbi:MAG: 50S ribosomal protein L18 [Candidatus Omnitrophica bacterium]|nr:50S ribosomal protein L18 [Candidatus Omnitrophota bacterium]
MEPKTARQRRRERVRKKVIGTKEKPRLSVHRSLKHLYAQLVDDLEQKTLLSLSTLVPTVRESKKKVKGVEVASQLGKLFAEEAKSKGISRVVFDRSGYLYHGRVKAFAQACRENGLLF